MGRNILFTTLLLILSIKGSNILAYTHIPNVVCYDKADYQAGRQNWDVKIDDYGVVYFANSEGLLYNVFGEWGFKALPSKGMIRSLLVDKDTIWCGGEEYGYFSRSRGDLEFTSLGVTGGDQVWNIEAFGSKIFFQTDNNIIQYDRLKQTMDRQAYTEGLWSLIKWNGRLWVFLRDGQIGNINNGNFIKIAQFNELKNKEVRELFVHNNLLYIVMFDGQVYIFDGRKLSSVHIPNSYQSTILFSGMSYNDDLIGLGSVSDGFLLVDNNGNVVKKVNADDGLIDNTVLSVNSDGMGNIWLGLDYGIAQIKATSAINTVFKGAATYNIKDFNGYTYLATNKGVFRSANGGDFKLVENTGGQVWRIKKIEGQLFICHNQGLFSLVNNQPINIFNYGGVMDIAKFEGSDYYLISTYRGVVFAKQKGKNIEFILNYELWGTEKLVYDKDANVIWGEVAGTKVYKCKLNALNKVDIKEYTNVNKVLKTQTGVYFCNDSVVSQYADSQFVEVDLELLSELKGKSIRALDISPDKNRVAYIYDGEIELDVLLPDGNVHSYNSLLKSVSENINTGYEFIDLADDHLRISTDRGVTVFDTKFRSPFKTNGNPVISSVTIINEDNRKIMYPFAPKGFTLSKGYKDLRFRFGINKSVHDVVEYRYSLSPKEKQWSEWSTLDNEVFYSRLKGGQYTLNLQSRVNAGEIDETSLSFSIKKIWYQTWLIVIPILFIVFAWIFGVIFIMSRISKRKLKRQKQVYVQETAQKTLEMKNDQLLQYTEIISHKNEFLIKVKSGLESMRNNDAKRWANMIADEVSNEKKEFLFHKLFSEIHQDFINRLTEKYPGLTSNDIRILSFIRINLGNREISNLMNITSRSLDTNRYRLRKKLELDHDTDLNQFVRDF